ncbi:hypothetical protein CSUI_004772, partial [Cystoisospora suis]
MPFFSRRRRDKAAEPSHEISSSPSSPVPPPVSVPSTSLSASASSVAHHKDKNRTGRTSLFSSKRTSSRLSSCDRERGEDHVSKKEASDPIETTRHKRTTGEYSAPLQSFSSSSGSPGGPKTFSHLPNRTAGGGGGAEEEGDLPSREKTAFSYSKADKYGEKPDASSSRPGRRSFSRHFSWKGLSRSFSSCRSSSSTSAAGGGSGNSSSSSSSSASRGSLFKKKKGKSHRSGEKSFSKKSNSSSSFSSSPHLDLRAKMSSSSHNESGGGTGGSHGLSRGGSSSGSAGGTGEFKRPSRSLPRPGARGQSTSAHRSGTSDMTSWAMVPVSQATPPGGLLASRHPTPEDLQSPEGTILGGLFSTRKPKDAGAGLSSGLKSVGKGVAAGAASLFVLPAVGATQQGVGGFFKGVGAGVIAAVALPVTGVCVAGYQVARGLVNTPEAIHERSQGKKWDKKNRVS